jgi:hypothetical protein
MKKSERVCPNCFNVHDIKETARVYGKESMVVLSGHCSAKCYTEHSLRLKTDTKVKWTMCGLQYGGWPEMSKRPNCKNECSDLLLVFCEDGEIRTGRFYKKNCSWMITGVCGAPQGFVRYWSTLNITEETEKMKARTEADNKWIKDAEDFQSQGSRVTDV